MTGQHEKPNFVVDSSGNVHDARHSGYGSSQVPPGRPPSNGNDSHLKPHSSRHPRRTTYLIPIPIGLIIFLVVSLIRHFNQPEKSANVFDSQSAYRMFRSGSQHFFSGDYDQALIYYGMALDSEPDVGEMYNRRGLVFEAIGEYDRALADFDRALELMADPAMVYNNRAITYLAMGDCDKAITDLDRAIELQPNLGKAYYNRGIIYHTLGEYDKAIADLDQAFQFSSERSHDMLPLPTVQQSTPFREMMETWDKEQRALESWAHLPSVYYQRGLAYLAKGEYERAIVDLREAIQLQPDLSVANDALTLAYAAIADTPSAQAIPGPSSTGTGWPTATDWAFPSEAETAVSFEQPPTPVAVYVPQPHETPTTPVWEITQESCDGQRFEMWVSPGRYLYRVTPDGGGSYLVAVVQELRETAPGVGQCRLPWLNYGGASSTESSETAADANENYRDFCAYDSSAPPGAVTTTRTEVETKRIDLGTFLTVREDTSYKYHLPYPKYVNEPQGTIATSEWYACGYGLIRSWTSHTGKYQGRDFEKEYGMELVSFTPLSTNECHVRYILVDAQLSGSVAAYRAAITDEETAEALRRWDAGVRVANIEEFERRIISGQWQIVFSGTRNPIIGTDLILTTDSSR